MKNFTAHVGVSSIPCGAHSHFLEPKIITSFACIENAISIDYNTTRNFVSLFDGKWHIGNNFCSCVHFAICRLISIGKIHLEMAAALKQQLLEVEISTT